MANELSSSVDQALALIREGKLNEADALLVKAQADEAAAAEAAGAPKPPSPPRARELVIVDLFTKLADLHGNHPVLGKLLEELTASLKKAGPAQPAA